MNYNEEMIKLFDSLGMEEGHLRKLSDEEKATPYDYQKLQERMDYIDKKNNEMLYLSSIYAQNSMPCLEDTLRLVRSK